MKLNQCTLIEPFKCSEDDSVVEVAKKLRPINLRHIFVVNKEDYPIGIISVIDISNRVVAEAKDASKLTAKDIMSKPIDVCDINDEVEKVYQTMVEKQRVLNPVVKDKKMIGIITLPHLLRHQNEWK